MTDAVRDRQARWTARVVWLLGLAVAVGLALTRMPGVFIEGAMHPIGNDSFYHAMRMLAVAVDPVSTHAFDPHINWPDGLWIAWPWAYDYLGGILARTFASGRDAMLHLLAFYPLLWLSGSVTVMALLARRLLKPPLSAICLLAYAAAPLTLSLYEVGMLDHHGAEHFWLLLNLYLTALWLEAPQSIRRAATLGAALALATAFHNGLFLLQIPLVLSLLLARLLDYDVPRGRSAAVFTASLLGVQLLVLVPSHAFRTGQYAFYFLSWFQLHVALLTALAVWALAMPRKRHMWLLLALGLAAAIPATQQLLFGLRYVRSELPLFDVMRETRAPFSGALSARAIGEFYSGLIWLWPLGLIFALYRLVSRRVAGASLVVMVSAVLWLSLMLTQIRMYYFGYAFLILLTLMLVQQLIREHLQAWVGGGLMLAAMLFSMHHYLDPIAPGGSPRYTSGWPLIYAARAQCSEDPGPLLADHNWGNFLRYQTDCPLISNNFLVSKPEVAAMRRSVRMLAQSPRLLRENYPGLRYVLVSRMDASPLAESLLSSRSLTGYRVVKLMKDRSGKVMGGLYEIRPPGGG